MSDIDFITFSAAGSNEYIHLLRKSAETFKSNEHNIHYKAVMSGDKANTICPAGFEDLGTIPHEHMCSSYNHSIAVNYALTKVTSEYVILIDADICLLYKGWDDVIATELDTGIGCYGFNRCREKFPSIFMFCFKRELLKNIKLDFRPNVFPKRESVKKYHIRTKREADWRQSRIGGRVKCDTGWRIPVILKGDGRHMECVLSRSEKKQLPWANDTQRFHCVKKPEHMCEWHYKGKIFGTHKQASRSHPLSSFYGRHWKNRIDLYTQKEFGITL